LTQLPGSLFLAGFDSNGDLQTLPQDIILLPAVLFLQSSCQWSSTISSFGDITWNQATQTIGLTVNSTAATITGIVVPLKVDVVRQRDGGIMQ